ncbi:hypothetical protein QQS21_003578 [Conoideocrella luteorostrata]|uniref:Alpha/beta hydrolase fold-3 domain-containing protein n=1 Tax=Conoideocrella luteorostrata TaxID=1105319 RepID=A0AAJ0CT66_9HYPO|nr:hypothetical protein QQS21_003578 [Conoideocrella luteorostrata]
MQKEAISENWLEYEKLHGGRFCFHGSAEEIIQQVEQLVAKLTPPKPSTVATDLQIEHVTVGGVPTRIYRPILAQPNSSLPLCLFSHGGGFIAGSLDSEDGLCQWIARTTPCVVMSIDYRLGPTHKLPAMVEDVVSVFEVVSFSMQYPEELNIDISQARRPENGFVTEQTDIFAMGGSAGGALSFALANYACKDRQKHSNSLKGISGVVALAPVTVHPDNVPVQYRDMYTSYEETASDIPIMDAKAMWTYFEAVDAVPTDSSIFTILSPRLQHFPPTYIITCGVDPLRDDGIAMAKALQNAGYE